MARMLMVVLVLLCTTAAATTAAGTSPASPVPRTDPDAESVGVWPLTPVPEVVATFDPPDSPYGGGHRGVDLAGRSGQTVSAALAGKVTFAGRIAGRGVVVIGHGATRTTYEPVTATVALGDLVLRGASIGRLEVVGSHCFPRACLHWGWIAQETYLDPLRLVGGGPVRLLPLWRHAPATPTHANSWSPLGKLLLRLLQQQGVVW